MFLEFGQKNDTRVNVINLIVRAFQFNIFAFIKSILTSYNTI